MSPANKYFDLDLTHGKHGENLVGKLLADDGKLVEVKRDRETWKTGNFAIELRCRGQKSGLSITAADWWAEVLDNEKGEMQSVHFFRTASLKDFIVRNWGHLRKCYGGDKEKEFPKGVSWLVLVPAGALILFHKNLDFDCRYK